MSKYAADGRRDVEVVVAELHQLRDERSAMVSRLATFENRAVAAESQLATIREERDNFQTACAMAESTQARTEQALATLTSILAPVLALVDKATGGEWRLVYKGMVIAVDEHRAIGVSDSSCLKDAAAIVAAHNALTDPRLRAVVENSK